MICLSETFGCQQACLSTNIINHTDNRSNPDHVTSLSLAHARQIVRGRASSNVKLGVKISISAAGDGFIFMGRISFDDYNIGEDLKARTRSQRRRNGHYPKVICADQINRTCTNRAFWLRHGIRLSEQRLGRQKNESELLAKKERCFLYV